MHPAAFLGSTLNIQSQLSIAIRNVSDCILAFWMPVNLLNRMKLVECIEDCGVLVGPR